MRTRPTDTVDPELAGKQDEWARDGRPEAKYPHLCAHPTTYEFDGRELCTVCDTDTGPWPW